MTSLAVLAILAACGGADNETQVVEGRGFTFEAPADWSFVRTPRAIGAQGDAVELVQVMRAFSPSLLAGAVRARRA